MFGILQLEKEYYSDRQLVRLLIEATSTRSVESLQRLSEMRWAELKKMNVEGITGLICEYCICKFQWNQTVGGCKENKGLCLFRSSRGALMTGQRAKLLLMTCQKGKKNNFCYIKRGQNFHRILLIWSTKWSLFTKLFAQMGCKSRDESNDGN